MLQKMRSLNGHMQLVHEGESYTPDKDGFFQIPLKHVGAARSHGLLLAGEADSVEAHADQEARMADLQKQKADLARQVEEAALLDEIAQLKAKVAELEGVKSGKASKKAEASKEPDPLKEPAPPAPGGAQS